MVRIMSCIVCALIVDRIIHRTHPATLPENCDCFSISVCISGCWSQSRSCHFALLQVVILSLSLSLSPVHTHIQAPFLDWSTPKTQCPVCHQSDHILSPFVVRMLVKMMDGSHRPHRGYTGENTFMRQWTKLGKIYPTHTTRGFVESHKTSAPQQHETVRQWQHRLWLVDFCCCVLDHCVLMVMMIPIDSATTMERQGLSETHESVVPSFWLVVCQRVVTFKTLCSRTRALTVTLDTSLYLHWPGEGYPASLISCSRLHRPIRPVIVSPLWRVIHILYRNKL